MSDAGQDGLAIDNGQLDWSSHGRRRFTVQDLGELFVEIGVREGNHGEVGRKRRKGAN